MKSRLCLFIALVLSALLACAANNKTTEVFTLDHQMSSHCEKKIMDNLRFEKGVSNLEVSLKANTITITYDPAKTNTEKLLKAFKKIGFNAELVTPGCAPAKKSGGTCPRCPNHTHCHHKSAGASNFV